MSPIRNGRGRRKRQLTPRSLFLATALAVVAAASSARLAASPAPQGQQKPSAGRDVSPAALSQIEALVLEKRSRTPAQRKLDSQLLYEIKMARGQAIANGVATLVTELRYSDDKRLEVDVSAQISDPLLEQLRALGVEIVRADPRHRSLRLRATLDQLEPIAALPQVAFVQPKQEAITARFGGVVAGDGQVVQDDAVRPPSPRVKRDPAALAAYLKQALESPADTAAGTGQGSQSSEGDLAHRAFAARGTFHVDGTGVKIGVLSDGVTNLAASQALGDLGTVTVLPGQAGTGDEGTAMLEIIHDLAPGAQLYFATAFGGIASFAQNIGDLRAAGCDIIVDDVFYFVETPFQDGQAPAVVSTTNGGVVIQAVKDVTAAGALYFSSAGNSGNLNDETSGVWEGDFVDGGATAAPLPAGQLHSFGAQTFNVLTLASSNPIVLYWSDPLGASANDYDLFRLDSTGATVLASSTNIQSGTQDPYEQVVGDGAAANQRIVIVKSASAAPRFLHLNTNRGRLSIGTAGQTHGHSATSAPNSFGVAATWAGAASPNPFDSSNVVETFSSDGGRRIFFTSDGTAITPGDFLASGGQLLNKPDITAADGVAVTGVGGFSNPFFGTSAAAPHAAAIAGLIKSSNPALTATQVRTAMVSSAIDIEAAGLDRDSGAGIVMGYQGLQAAGATGTAFLTLSTFAASESPGNGNGAINVGEGASLSVNLTNLGVTSATAISATLTTSTPGVTVTLPGQSAYANIASGASGTNTTPFRFTLASNAACPLTVDFTLTVTYAGVASPAVIPLQVTTRPPFTITTVLDGVTPTASAGVTTATGTQTGRLNRFAPASTCAAAKTTPTLFEATGARRFDSYSIATCAESVASCATVTLSGATAVNLFTAAYSPSYNPANPQQNYLADPGSSSNAGVPYSFNVASGVQSLAVAVHEVSVGGGVGAQYTLAVSGLCAGGCATPNQVPVAIAQDVTVVAGPGGTASASINNGSFDPDGDALTITQSPPGPYPVGTTSVLLTVNDPKGATGQATGNVTVTSSATSTTVTSSSNPSQFGQLVTFTATVTSPAGTPTGTVQFKDGAATMGTGSLSSGSATFSTAALGPGSHSITAVYGGDANFASSTSPPLVQVLPSACPSLITSVPCVIEAQGHYRLANHVASSSTSGAAITIAANSVLLDLKGYKIGGQAAGIATSAVGVRVQNHSTVVIRNGLIRGFAAGVWFDGGVDNNNNIVEDVYADANTYTGIYVGAGSNNTVRRCTVGATGGTTHTVAFTAGIWIASERSFATSNMVTGTAPAAAGSTYYGVALGASGRAVDNQVIGDGNTGNPGNVCFILDSGAIYRDNVASRCGTSYSGGTVVGTTNFP